jgi:hypothetical protein
MTQESKNSQLYSALAKAQAACAGTAKKSSNDHHRYKYASAEDMIDAATQAMAPNDLWLVCTSAVPDDLSAPKAMTVMYLLGHASGDSMVLGPYSLTTHPDRGRPGDKAVTTCLTYLQAYCIRGILNVPRVEEGTERDSQDDAMIQAYASEQQKARVKAETAARKEHAKNQKILKAKGERVNENGPEFFKAASVEWCTQNKIKFMVWASSADEWPGRGKIDQQIEVVDESLQFLMAWKQLDEIEALREAHDFGVEINGAPDHDARAEAAFEASLEANK